MQELNKTQDLLKRLRRKGWNNTKLSEALDVSRITLVRWARGEKPQHQALVEFGLEHLLEISAARNKSEITPK